MTSLIGSQPTSEIAKYWEHLKAALSQEILFLERMNFIFRNFDSVSHEHQDQYIEEWKNLSTRLASMRADKYRLELHYFTAKKIQAVQSHSFSSNA